MDLTAVIAVIVAFTVPTMWIVGHKVEQWRIRRRWRVDVPEADIYSGPAADILPFPATGKVQGEYLQVKQAAEWVCASNGWKVFRYFRKYDPDTQDQAWFVHVDKGDLDTAELSGPALVRIYEKHVATYLKNRHLPED